MISFTIPGELIDLNNYINAERTNKFRAAMIKKAETHRVMREIQAAKVKKITEPITEMICVWYTKNEKKDADNVTFAIKFILDGMVAAKILPDDSRKWISCFTHIVDVGEKPRVEIEIR